MIGGIEMGNGIRALRVLLISVAIVSFGLLSSTSAWAAFGIEPASLKLTATNPAGAPLTQAGGHPDFTTEFGISRVGGTAPAGDLRDADVELPPGLVGNATITPKCSMANVQFEGGSRCPPDTIVGRVNASVWDPVNLFVINYPAVPLYNVEPLEGEPAAFAGLPATFPIRIDTSIGPEGGYRVHAVASQVTELAPVLGASVTLWGVPFDHSGVGLRRPLMINPTECTGRPLDASVSVDSWENPGAWVSSTTTMEPISGCDKLRFSPTINVHPTTQSAGVPSGYSVDVNVPQNENADGLATPTLKDATVTFPEGVALSPSIAHGLGACTDSQLQLHGNTPVSCPNSANIGSVEITSPLLDHVLRGSVYVGQPVAGNRYRIFFVIEEGKIVIKLEGRVSLDPRTGQVSTTFVDNPQLPFSNLHVDLKGGPDAALVNPESCGPKTVTSTLTSAANNIVTPSNSFTVSGNCANGEFKPKLEAGVSTAVGGSYSPFVLRISREDGTEQLRSLSVTMPKGLLGRLAGIPYCSDAALASIPTAPETGAAQIANPSCPAASRVGTTVVGAGAGSDPFFIDDGPVYLAGPYKGAPLSLAIVTPAVAGPFDLGNVVVRTALNVDPSTTQITAVSDPLPSILDGVPLDLRSAEVKIDRPEFIRNPTNCDAASVQATIASLSGQTARPSVRFQIAGCAELGFKPTLALALKGGMKRAAHPALTATLKAPKGEANIAKTQVVLPKSEFIDNAHISNPCTRVQFNAGACPAKSILGTATAYSPLLEKPLTGPVYFRSNGGERKLPDLVADLNGQIHVVLVGFIDSVKSGKEGSRVRTRFLSVPDAPVSKFVLSLKGGKQGLIENSVDLCRSPQKATVKMEGQNGKTHDFSQKIATSCGKKKSKKGKKKG